jgi:hypothetical protein
MPFGSSARLSAVLLTGALGACASALFTAPPGTEMTLQANPQFVASHGGAAGRSLVTALLIEPAGTLVADGTIVLCFTNLGTIEPQVKTKNGIAQANFTSDARSGTARVTCVSGGAAPAPAPVPSASASPGGGGTVGSGTGSATTDILVGSVQLTAKEQISLNADPPRITISNSTHVRATVIDKQGNPLPNVPVQFFVVDSSEFMDSAGHPIFTNNNGQAEDVMRTRRLTAGAGQVFVRVAGAGVFVQSDPLSIPIL